MSGLKVWLWISIVCGVISAVALVGKFVVIKYTPAPQVALAEPETTQSHGIYAEQSITIDRTRIWRIRDRGERTVCYIAEQQYAQATGVGISCVKDNAHVEKTAP